jgi:FkbM family methyltransferase
LGLKNFIRRLSIRWGLDLTKNLEYDRYTLKIIKEYLPSDSVCIDVGCHKGEVLQALIDHIPNGKFYGVEPIPELHAQLQNLFRDEAIILPYALSDRRGESSFVHVKKDPAYSGLVRRKYDFRDAQAEEIQVQVEMMDHLFQDLDRVDFVKIDVEGGEFGVLKGGLKLLSRHRPLIVFECGLGASDYYGTQPEELHQLLKSIGYKIYTMKSFIDKGAALSELEFQNIFHINSEYYFVAKG